MQIEIKIANPHTGLERHMQFTSELPPQELTQAFEEMFLTALTDSAKESCDV